MNPLANHPEIRKWLYVAQYVSTGVMGALAVLFEAQGGYPGWYPTVSAVLMFAWSYLGVTAASNTPTSRQDGGGDE